MKGRRSSILLYFDNFHRVADLPDEQLGILFRALMECGEKEAGGEDGITGFWVGVYLVGGGVEGITGFEARYPGMGEKTQMAFSFMADTIRRDAAAYAEKCANYQSAAQRRAEQRQDAVPGKERLDALVRHMREEQKKPERPDWAAR